MFSRILQRKSKSECESNLQNQINKVELRLDGNEFLQFRHVLYNEIECMLQVIICMYFNIMFYIY